MSLWLYKISFSVKSRFARLGLKNTAVLKTRHHFANLSAPQPLRRLPPLESTDEIHGTMRCDLSINCSIERIGEPAFFAAAYTAPIIDLKKKKVGDTEPLFRWLARVRWKRATVPRKTVSEFCCRRASLGTLCTFCRELLPRIPRIVNFFLKFHSDNAKLVLPNFFLNCFRYR